MRIESPGRVEGIVCTGVGHFGSLDMVDRWLLKVDTGLDMAVKKPLGDIEVGAVVDLVQDSSRILAH